MGIEGLNIRSRKKENEQLRYKLSTNKISNRQQYQECLVSSSEDDLPYYDVDSSQQGMPIEESRPIEVSEAGDLAAQSSTENQDIRYSIHLSERLRLKRHIPESTELHISHDRKRIKRSGSNLNMPGQRKHEINLPISLVNKCSKVSRGNTENPIKVGFHGKTFVESKTTISLPPPPCLL